MKYVFAYIIGTAITALIVAGAIRLIREIFLKD